MAVSTRAVEDTLREGPASEADVLVQEFEDFTPPALRPQARAISTNVIAAWRDAGVTTAVRVNQLAEDGMDDLAAVMAGRPDIVMLPKVSEPQHVSELDAAVARFEREFSIPENQTELLPNIESARGLVQVGAIVRASDRVRACPVASEDMAADLGAERGQDGIEVAYVRQRFHIECTAAGVLSIDSPYAWQDEVGLRTDTLYGRRLGYRAKSAVAPAQARIINELLTPSGEELAKARRIVAAFEAARAGGEGRAEVDGALVEIPIYLNAKRRIKRTG